MSETQKYPLMDRINKVLDDSDPNPDEMCDLIEEITGESTMIESNMRGKILELRQENRVHLLLYLAARLEFAADTLEESGKAEPGFVEMYREAAHHAKDAVKIVAEIDASNARIAGTSNHLRVGAGNTFNIEGDVYKERRSA